MPKLNSNRIVNLTYNNNSENAATKIMDEIFELDCEHTLKLLRNGGGKTVQTQMMIAPYVSPRYRNLGNRNFEDYFTDEKNPTYIAAEWVLESGEKILIGLVVKKGSSQLLENEPSGLDIMSYVYEYVDDEDEYSIKNIPFSKRTENGYVVLSMNDAEELFKRIKSKNKFTFDYYNLNIDSNRSRYYKKLRSYSIEPNEWETIMRTINQEEGGLAKLFDNSKTEEGLIDAWFLKNIHSKLNKDDDVVKELQMSVKKYVENKMSKQNLIDIIEGIEEYKYYTKEILLISEKYKEILENKFTKEEKIKELLIYNYKENKKIGSELDYLNLEKDNTLKLIAMNNYEEESYKYHTLVRERDMAEVELLDENSKLESLKNELKKLERDENLHQVINLNNQKEERVKELESIQAKIDKELKSNKEIEAELSDVSYTLKALLSKEKDKYNNDINECLTKDKELTKQKDESEKSIINLKTEQGILKSDIKKYEDGILKEYTNLLDDMKSKHELPLYVDEGVINDLKLSFINKMTIKENEYSNTLKDIDNINKELEELKNSINNSNIKKIKLENESKNLKEKLIAAEKNCEEILNVLDYINEEETKLFDNTYIINKLLELINKTKSNIDYNTHEKIKKIQQIDMIKKGVITEIPTDIKDKLNELGINYDLGLNYLNNLKISDMEKEKLLISNPFLPFSLVLSSEDIDLLKKIDLDISSSYNLLIANKDKLMQELNLKIDKNIYQIDKLNILFNFNKALLSENIRKNTISNIELEVYDLTNIIKEFNEDLSLINEYLHKVKGFNITENYLLDLKNKINKNDGEIDEITFKIANYEKRKEEILNKVLKEKEELLSDINNQLKSIKIEVKEIDKFLNSYLIFNKEYSNVKMKEDRIDIINNELDKLSLFVEEIKSNLALNEASIWKLKELLKDVLDEINEIDSLNLNLDNANVLVLEKNVLEAKFKALKSKSFVNIDGLEESLKVIKKNINRIEKEMNIIITHYSIDKNEYINEIYLEEFKERIKYLKDVKSEEIEAQIKVVTDKTVVLEKLKESVVKKQKLCKKIYENTKAVYTKVGSEIDFIGNVLDLETINIRDFKEEENKLKEELSIIESKKDNLDIILEAIRKSNQRLDFFSYIIDNIEHIDSVDVDLDINPIEDLDDITTELIKDFKLIEENINENKKHMEEAFSLLTINFKYKDISPFSKNIQELISMKEEPSLVITFINTSMECLDRLKRKHEYDLSVINEEKENILNTILKYVEEVYAHFGTIDKNSRIDIDGENQKMLEIKQPNWDIVLYNTKIKDYFDNIVSNCEKRIALGEPMDEYIAVNITTSKLYNAVVGISNVRIHLKKLEYVNNKIATSRIKWKDVMKNSGGEGFVSAFVILVSLLSYMRTDNEVLSSKKEEGKVIIMDNPFGKMSSEHLIKPVMTIANKYNVQLICYTAQKGDNIYNRFPNIYHMDTEYIAGAKVNVLTATRKKSKYKESQLKKAKFSISEQETFQDMF